MKTLTPAQATKPRSRRLRKKLHIGEFQEFGFNVEVRLAPGTDPTFDQALNAWIAFVESHAWAFGGGGSVDGRTISGFVARFHRGTLTGDDRLIVGAWIRETSWVEGGEIGLLRDAWYDW